MRQSRSSRFAMQIKSQSTAQQRYQNSICHFGASLLSWESRDGASQAIEVHGQAGKLQPAFIMNVTPLSARLRRCQTMASASAEAEWLSNGTMAL